MKTIMTVRAINGMFLLNKYAETTIALDNSQVPIVESIIESIIEPIINKC